MQATTEAASYPEGEPADSWTVTQLKAFLNANSIEYTSGDLKADLLEKAKAAYTA